MAPSWSTWRSLTQKKVHLLSLDDSSHTATEVSQIIGSLETSSMDQLWRLARNWCNGSPGEISGYVRPRGLTSAVWFHLTLDQIHPIKYLDDSWLNDAGQDQEVSGSIGRRSTGI